MHWRSEGEVKNANPPPPLGRHTRGMAFEFLRRHFVSKENIEGREQVLECVDYKKVG